MLRFKRSFSFVGLVMAAVGLAASVTPSLLPRTPAVQGVLSGVAMAVGYGVGVAGVWAYRYFGWREPDDRRLAVIRVASATVAVALGAASLTQMTAWQNSIRTLMNIDPIESAYPMRTLAIAVAVACVVVTIVRGMIGTGRRVSRRLDRVMPRRVAVVIAGGLVAAGVSFVTNDVVVAAALRAADGFFARWDATFDGDAGEPPSFAGDGSRIGWDSIGRQGKVFLTSGPTASEIGEFNGTPAADPIRVYAGWRSADTMAGRAELALAELQRRGGFDRSVLIVATPTGTGWLDPSAVDTVEYLHGGDTAIVATQYSYLPSWMTLYVDPQRSIDSARALFDVVYEHWKTLPENDRPRLYLHGLSLGALGSERSADLYTVFEDPIEGAVWSGPPFPSEVWRSLVRNRRPDTPPWSPKFRDGRLVRFLGGGGAVDRDRPWGPMRNVYVQYSSDPMVWFRPSLAWQRPDWLTDPPGPDVSPQFRWYPLVTLLQVAMDIPLATSVPIGHGHNYAPADYIDAWVAVTDPPHGTEERVSRLRSIFTRIDPPAP